MRPAHLLLAVAGVATLGFGGAGLAAGITWLRIDHVERELAAEFDRLHQQIPGLASNEPSYIPWLAVENRLNGVLARVRAADTGVGGLAFAAPGMQNEAWSGVLRSGLESRAEDLTELAAVLQAIADQDVLVREPFDPARSAHRPPVPSDSLAALRSATNLLCGQAWLVGRDPERAEESARWLVLALTLARVTDDGPGFSFGARVGMENIALACAAKLVAEDRHDPVRLCEPIRAELVRGAPRNRLRSALECELLQLEWCFRSGRTQHGLPIPEGRRAEELQALHEALFERSRQLAGDPDGHWQELSRTRVDTDTPALRNNLTFLAGSMKARETHIARLFPDGLGG